jgi:hypothetical protein
MNLAQHINEHSELGLSVPPRSSSIPKSIYVPPQPANAETAISAAPVTQASPYTLIKNFGFASPDFHCYNSTTELTRLAADASAVFYLNVSMLASIKLKASGAGATTLDISVGGYV